MLSFDTNLAVHAANRDSASHEQCRDFIDSGILWRPDHSHRRYRGGRSVAAAGQRLRSAAASSRSSAGS